VTRSVERANQLVRRHLATHLDRLGVSEIEAHLLARLGAKGPMPLSELQRAFGLRPSTLTNALDRLQGRGLLLRRSDPDDRRTFVLDLTAAGRKAAREVVGVVDGIEGRVANAVSAQQLRGFLAVIAALEGSLE